MLLNDLMKQLEESIEKSTGPKFTGYWKAKDNAPPGNKLVGEEANPTDKITMDVPLFIRMMEYAREDAKDDMDLHSVTDRAIALMKEHEYLCMDNYNDLVGGETTGGEQPTNEFKDTAKYGNDNGKNINHEIFQLLKNGATVYSNAAGRMGKVLRANNDGVVIASKRGKGFTSFNSGDPVKIKQDENEPNTYHIINEEKKGLYYNVNKRKKAGTSRPKGHSKAPSDQDWKDAAKTAKKEGIGEDKKKGADGKSCWKGYRYAGTEDGKDKCVPVKKGK